MDILDPLPPSPYVGSQESGRSKSGQGTGTGTGTASSSSAGWPLHRLPAPACSCLIKLRRGGRQQGLHLPSGQGELIMNGTTQAQRRERYDRYIHLQYLPHRLQSSRAIQLALRDNHHLGTHIVHRLPTSATTSPPVSHCVIGPLDGLVNVPYM